MIAVSSVSLSIAGCREPLEVYIQHWNQALVHQKVLGEIKTKLKGVLTEF